jgi:hypothetical protein
VVSGFWLAVRSREIAIGRNFLLAAPAVAQKGKAAVFPFWQPGANPSPNIACSLGACMPNGLVSLFRLPQAATNHPASRQTKVQLT